MELHGKIKNIRFQNEENGFTIGTLVTSERSLTFVGTLPGVFEGETIKVNGAFLIDPKWGEQFKVESFEEIIPSTSEGMIKYLSSGMIRGIGPQTAKKIVDTFKEKTFEIMDNNIDELSKVEGIGKKKLNIIKQNYIESRALRNIMVFLQPYGLTTKQCIKIFNRYGENSISQVKENPYRLSNEIKSFGFKTADKIAFNFGIEKNSPYRIESGIIYALNQYNLNGNTMMPYNILIDKAIELLEVEKKDVETAIVYSITNNGEIVVENLNGEDYVFSKSFLNAEKSIARKIYDMVNVGSKPLKLKFDDFISDYEKRNNIKLHEIQINAVKAACDNNLVIITGGPGTGKTTIIKCILEMLKITGQRIAMAAPTGRASKRMMEATGENASTIHRLLDLVIKDDEEEDLIDDDIGEELNFDAVIIDEASMIDVILMRNLTQALKNKTRLILVGDVDQLPSVGPGRVLGDLIDSKFVKTIKLERIYRQSNESMITTNAHLINEGKSPILNSKGSDFFFIKANEGKEAIDILKDLVNKRLPKFNDSWDKIKDIQILSPMRKRGLGVEEVNEELRKVLNPKIDKTETFTDFRINDKVMQVKNNYKLKGRKTLYKEDDTIEDELGVFNGDIGYIANIDEENRLVTVIFDDERYVDYEEIDLDDLELAYAITIHKSQGSEFKVVIIPTFFGPPTLLSRNLLYTGVTRGRQLVVLLGNRQAMNMMVRNDKTISRHTALALRLLNIKELIN